MRKNNDERDDEDNRTLWCGNLHPKVTEDLLFELFLQAGPLHRVTIPKDKEGGKLRNFAFIVFKQESSVGYAMKIMDKTTMFGRALLMKNRKITSEKSSTPIQHQRGLSQSMPSTPTTSMMPLLHQSSPMLINYNSMNQLNYMANIQYQQQAQYINQQMQPKESPYRPRDNSRDRNSYERSSGNRHDYRDRYNNTSNDSYSRNSRSGGRSNNDNYNNRHSDYGSRRHNDKPYNRHSNNRR